MRRIDRSEVAWRWSGGVGIAMLACVSVGCSATMTPTQTSVDDHPPACLDHPDAMDAGEAVEPIVLNCSITDAGAGPPFLALARCAVDQGHLAAGVTAASQSLRAACIETHSSNEAECAEMRAFTMGLIRRLSRVKVEASDAVTDLEVGWDALPRARGERLRSPFLLEPGRHVLTISGKVNGGRASVRQTVVLAGGSTATFQVGVVPPCELSLTRRGGFDAGGGG